MCSVIRDSVFFVFFPVLESGENPTHKFDVSKEALGSELYVISVPSDPLLLIKSDYRAMQQEEDVPQRRKKSRKFGNDNN